MIENEPEPLNILMCPVCNEDLFDVGASIQCMNEHNFDKSRDNYVNLLSPNKKHSKQPGDDKESVQSRHKVFASGHFDKVVDSLRKEMNYHFGNRCPEFIVDLGCGEGHYLQKTWNRSPAVKIGFDISKYAIQTAAKNRPDCHWYVANSTSIPVKAGSVDILTCCFSPFFRENIDLIKRNGMLVLINAGPHHLKEITGLLYESDRPHLFDPTSRVAPLAHLKTQRVKYKIAIDNKDALRDYIRMTPHYYKSKKDNQTLLLNKYPDCLTIDVEIFLFSKVCPSSGMGIPVKMDTIA